ncbi:pilus assembly protein PilM [Lamprobacter modestohalophilus]|uniref:Pilus assembly protein PilM n=1 Tax=Lamprobacter modestohalophilus TaxID=1064514 RepID=A0A9X1B4N9_9GAMM|nr:type IV pilus assembly protein PilM [Lamprobacter modestohalophilus]MBK1619680.1 pilus assembly protein PilM [Lamprobacter modestohalophilus]
MFRFGRKQHALLGVDIGSSAIKLVELGPGSASRPEHFRVEALALEPLPSHTLVEKKIADVTQVGQAIAAALQRSKSKTKRAVVAVAGSAVITKVLSLSAELSDAEMEAQIQLEADQYVPYPLEEVNLDFDVLGPTEGSAGMVDVLLAASRQENVDDRVAALELAGLSVEIVDIESNAVENASGIFIHALAPGLDRLTAVADIGATTTTLHVLRGGQNIYAREQSFGGQQLVEEVQRRAGLGREEALSQLATASLPPQLQTVVLGPFQDALARQLARALQFFYSTSAFSQVDEVLLTGGVTQVPDLAQQIAERLALPVQIVDPFAKMALSPDAERVLSQHGRSTMLIAAGLAMRRFR